jgi:hypothetical protein
MVRPRPGGKHEHEFDRNRRHRLRHPPVGAESEGADSHLTDHWRDIIIRRDVHDLNSIAYPADSPLANSPLTARSDWRVDGIRPGSDLGLVRRHALDPFQTGIAIANSACMACGLCSARTCSLVSPAQYKLPLATDYPHRD